MESPEAKLAEIQAVLEAVDAALSGQPVSDFMGSFPLVARAQTLYARANPVFSTDGEYTTATVFQGDLFGVGVSRKPSKALSYALEDLAKQVSL